MEPAAGTVLHEMVHGDGPCMRHNELAYIQARLPTGLQSAFNSQQGCEHVTATTSSGTPQTIWRERCLLPAKVNFACSCATGWGVGVGAQHLRLACPPDLARCHWVTWLTAQRCSALRRSTQQHWSPSFGHQSFPGTAHTSCGEASIDAMRVAHARAGSMGPS